MSDWQAEVAAARKGLAQFTEAVAQLTALRDAATAEIAQFLRAESGVEIDVDAIKATPGRPYTILPINDHEAWLVHWRGVKMPIFGWVVAQEPAFIKARVTRTMDLLTPLPAWMKDELGWKPPAHAALIDGMRTAVRVTQGDESAFKRKYGSLLGAKQADGSIKIRGGDAWLRLVKQLVHDGILPYEPRSVAEEHWNPRVQQPFVLRDYQTRAVEEFRGKGAVSVIYPPGAGKTVIACAILNHLVGKTLVLADTTILVEQWRDRVKKFSPGAQVTVSTYQGAAKYLDDEWDLIIFDEVQRLPAPTFSRLAFAKTKYRLALTGTPWREDDGTYLIVALGGFPVAIRWAELINAGILKRPRIIVATVASEAAKTAYVRQVLAKRKGGRALIYCDWIEQGENLADALDVPFVHGDTQRKLERIQEAEVAVVSRIGDRGLDLPDLTLVVEVAGAGASREQFAQRVGRLLHGTFSGEFHTVFTPEEAEKFRPRIFGVEAELAGEVEIQFVNVGVLAETSANEKSIRRPGPVARPAAIKPGDEIGATLANPAVAKAIEKAYADAPAQVRSEKKIHAALRVAWDTAITLAELEAGRGIRGRALTNWKAAFAVAAKHKLTVKIGEGWMTNKAHLKKLVELSGRFKR